jgi:ribosomal protein S2
MKPYVESKTQEGLHLINPQAILDKIRLAARVIVTIDNPEDVIVRGYYRYYRRDFIQLFFTGFKYIFKYFKKT